MYRACTHSLILPTIGLAVLLPSSSPAQSRMRMNAPGPAAAATSRGMMMPTMPATNVNTPSMQTPAMQMNTNPTIAQLLQQNMLLESFLLRELQSGTLNGLNNLRYPNGQLMGYSMGGYGGGYSPPI